MWLHILSNIWQYLSMFGNCCGFSYFFCIHFFLLKFSFLSLTHFSPTSRRRNISFDAIAKNHHQTKNRKKTLFIAGEKKINVCTRFVCLPLKSHSMFCDSIKLINDKNIQSDVLFCGSLEWVSVFASTV